MMLNQITSAAGAHKRRRRVGRGESSGTGKTAGRGHKGCQARSGGGVRPLTEGGQMPIFRRIPKRGFSNADFRRRFEVVNLAALDRRFSDGDTVDHAALLAARLVQDPRGPVKVLAKGTLSKKLTVEAHAFSEKARQQIEQAGGSVKVVEMLDRAEAARAKRNSAKSRKPEPKPSRLEKKKSRREAAGNVA